MKDWRSWLPWVPAVLSFGGFGVVWYLGVDPFPETVSAVLTALGAVALPVMLWWLARDWRPAALVVPGLLLTFVPYRVYRGWLGAGLTGTLLAEVVMLLLQAAMLAGLAWGLVKARRRGAWRWPWTGHSA